MRCLERSSSATIISTRSSDLSPSSSIVVPGPTARPPAYARAAPRPIRPSLACAGAAPVATHAAISRRLACACLPCAATRLRPHGCSANPLMVRQLGCSPRARPRRRSAPASSTSTACTRSSVPVLVRRRPRTSRTPGRRFDHALDVLGKDVQPFGGHDHFLLAARMNSRPSASTFADVARVEPSSLEAPAAACRRL